MDQQAWNYLCASLVFVVAACGQVDPQRDGKTPGSRCSAEQHGTGGRNGRTRGGVSRYICRDVGVSLPVVNRPDGDGDSLLLRQRVDERLLLRVLVRTLRPDDDRIGIIGI